MPSETSRILKTLMKRKSGNQNTNNQIKMIPNEEFSHKHSLINNPETRNVINFEDFLSKDLAIAYIEDDRLLQLKAAHIRLVQIPLLQMKEECEDPIVKVVLEDLFNFFHVSFIADLKMSRSKKGFERKLQARIMEAEQEKQQGLRIPKLKPSDNQGEGDVKLYD